MVVLIILGDYMKLTPIRDRIVVRLLEADTVTKSGIIIPDSAAEKPNQGEVLAAGTGKIGENGVTVPMVVKTGDKVLFSKFAGQTVKINNEEFHILKEDDVMAIINEGNQQ
jgi:chaperonin GroES